MNHSFKYIHAADLHLDSRVSAIKNFYGQKTLCLAKEQQKAFTSLIDLALSENIDFLVLSGDIFDSNWKDYSVGLFFIQQIKRLSCPIYMIRGNHDSENRLIKSLPYPDHLYIFDAENPQTELIEKCKVALHGQSYAKYHIEDDLGSNYPKGLDGYFNIGLLHTSGEKSNGESPYAPFDLDVLTSKGYDYWAFGHLHQNQIVHNHPPMVYSGVLQGRHIKETAPKGCYLISVVGGKIENLTFKELSSICWEKVILNISNLPSEDSLKEKVYQLVKDLVESRVEKSLILRFVFEGKNGLEQSIYENSDYYSHMIYCWLEELFSEQIYIEKIIDQCTYSSNIDKSPIIDYLLGELNDEATKKELGLNMASEYAAIEKKIPKEIIDLDKVEGLDSALLQQVQSFLEAKFSETNR